MPGHRHSPVQSRVSSPCWQVEKDGPVRRTVSAVSSSMMSTPSACLDTKGPQPGQQNSLPTTLNTILGREKHLCPPLRHLSLLRQYAVSVYTDPAAAQACTQQVLSTCLSLATASRFLASWLGSHGPGSGRERVHTMGEVASEERYSPQDKDQASRGSFTHRKRAFNCQLHNHRCH